MNNFESSSQSNSKKSSWLEMGRISSGDRIQRIVSGFLLMALTLSGLLEKTDWRSFVAIAIQAELLITAIAGWCPIYWGCRFMPIQTIE